VDQVLVEVNETFVMQLKKVSELLKSAGLTLMTKQHSRMMGNAKWSTVYNQIWIRK